MNPLLKHQINKFLSAKNVSSEDLKNFIDAVNSSYNNFDDQIGMLQRALMISSEELSEANKKLQQETQVQRNLIDKLNTLIKNLKLDEIAGVKKSETINLDGEKLTEFIEKQTQELISMNAQREKLLTELESQNQELSDYAYLVSHDLKSPLRSIDALAAWLNPEQEGNSQINTVENLNLIRANVEKMDNLITGILNYSTINKNQTIIGAISVSEIVVDVLKTIVKPSHVTIKVHDDLPIIQGDKFRIKQLFHHLLDNAIKYADKKNGLVELGFIDEPNHWKFYVKDNGIGIEKDYHDKIFKPFQKLENNPSATGIGLSIAKKIVLAYGGKIWLESKTGKGATFYFTLKK